MLRIRKKFSYVGFVMFAMTMMFFTNKEVKASAIVPVSITEVTDIATIQTTAAETVSPILQTENSIIFSFQMPKPGYVKMVASQNASIPSVYYGARCDFWGLISSELEFKTMVLKGKFDYFKPNTQEFTYSYLEAGTYYVKLMRAESDTAYYADGTASLTVYAQYVDRTNTSGVIPASYEMAVPIDIGQNIYGFFTEFIRKQCYKITLSTDSQLTISAKGINAIPISTHTDFDVLVLNSNQEKLYSFSSGYSNNIMTSGSCKLKSGTYYVILNAGNLSRDSQYFFGTAGQSFLNVVSQPIDITNPIAPELVYYKTNGVYVKGTGESGTTAYVTVGNTVYSKIVDASGKFSVKTTKLTKGTTIKAYLKDTAGNLSSTTTVTTKSNPKIDKVTKYKKGTKYIEGKATKGTTVYVKVGTKTYHVKANSKAKFKVKTVKLSKNKKISIYTIDSAGNKSKTITLKVK